MPSPPALQEATRNSTTAWQKDLEALFAHAKDRFPDVVWDLVGEDNLENSKFDQVWGHKAVVYARAPPTFQARYFSFRPAPISSPLPYYSPNDTIDGQSALSLTSIHRDHPNQVVVSSRSPSPHRAPSPSPSSGQGGILRLTTSINPTLFSNELEYLYTGKGFGEAFEFLYETPESRNEGDAEDARIEKLRKDLVFMWRSRLYSDVRISLTGSFPSSTTNNDGQTTAVFSSHRFILVSRCSYFHTQLIGWGSPPPSKPNEPLTVKLPSPPFTPASLHFTLGFIYTGTLVFSHRSFDLETAFHIMRSARYLGIQELYDEIQARVVQEMMHGLFHAFLEFSEYERITSGKWGTGGCRCRQCARRAPRILEFSMQEDVKNSYLEAGTRRALVGMFGEGWCNPEFAALPQKTRETLSKGLAKRTTPINYFALLFAAHHALGKLSAIIESWADVVREMVLSARKVIDDVVCAKSQECFEQEEWIEVMQSDGVRFEDAEKVEWVMDSVKRGLTERTAGMVYQTLVSSILLRPHATETDATMLSNTSHVRVKVQGTCTEVLRWIRKRWVGIRQAGGFDDLEGWSLKEISGEIEIPVEDLLPVEPKGPRTKMGLGPSVGKQVLDNDSDAVSLKPSVMSRTTNKQTSSTYGNGGTSVGPSNMSSAASVRSATSRASTATASRRPPPGPRPDSKLTPSSSSVYSQSTIDGRKTPVAKTVLTRQGANTRPTSTVHPERPASTLSTRSHASTVRPVATKTSTTLRPPSSTTKTLERPVSRTGGAGASSKNTSANTNASLRPTQASSRSRRASVASTVSNVSMRTATSRAAASPSPAAKSPLPPPPPLPPQPPEKNDAALKRLSSAGSVKSTTSATVPRKTNVPARKVSSPDRKTPPQPPNVTSATVTPGGTSTKSLKGKENIKVTLNGQKTVDASSEAKVQTVLKRKGSADTITKSSSLPVDRTLSKSTPSLRSEASTAKASVPTPVPARVVPLPTTTPTAFETPPPPRGATLDIGIPCIVSTSKRKRFKAFARYIGEVEGETGPWVGIEVPLGEWGWNGGDGERQDAPLWNDGSWGGVKYFEIGSSGSEWADYGDDKNVGKRFKMGSWSGKYHPHGGMKREGDALNVERVKRFRSASPATSDASGSESRGLFVRPQQVLYVVDAIGDL